MRAATSVLLVLLALAALAPTAPGAVVVRSPVDDVGLPFWCDWVAGRAANGGVLLSLAEWQDDFGAGGPYFPSRSFTNSSLRPRLVVVFTSPTGLAP